MLHRADSHIVSWETSTEWQGLCEFVEVLEYQSGTFFSWRRTSVWLCCELKDGQFDYFGIAAPPWPLVHVGRRIWGENY